MYSFIATCNYAYDEEIETPTFKPTSIIEICRLISNLLNTETEATSFVITIARGDIDAPKSPNIPTS